MKKNLAIFTSSKGGLSHYTTQLYGPLVKYTNPFFVTYSDGIIDELVVENVPEIYPLIKNNDALSILDTLDFLKDKKIDVINVNVATTARRYHMHYTALLSKAKLAGLKIIGTIHDVMPFESFYINPAAVELLYSCMDHYVVGSEDEKEKLKLYFQIPEEKISVAVHGPYTIFNNNLYDKESARKKLGIPKDKKVVLFFGMLRPHKGLKYLIRAFKTVLKEIPDAWLYISTDLNYSPELKEFPELIEKNGLTGHVQLVKKYVPSSEIEPIFKAADVVALPYTKVSQSGVLNIAYAFKKPVVVTNIFPESEQIQNRFGKVAKPRDVSSLAENLIELLGDGKSSEKFGKQSYDYARREHSWEKMASQLSKIVENV